MADRASSSLDSLETTALSVPPVSYHDYRASFHKAELDAARTAYSELDITNGSNKVDSLDSCRSMAYFYRNELTGEIKIISSCCRLRWCPFCSQGRKWRVSEECTAWLHSIKSPKMLTLTLKHADAPLEHQLKHLYAFFRTFRQRKYIRTYVAGGVWFFQIKRNSTDTMWHPHLHCLLDSTWLDQKRLSTTWHVITHGSGIVDIRAIHTPEQAAEYVARYAAKPAMLAPLSMPERIELITSLHGRRMVGTWGTAKRLSFRTVRPVDHEQWHNIGSYTTVSRQYRYDGNAAAIFNAWRKGDVLDSGIDMSHVECFIENRAPPSGEVAFDSHKQLSFAFFRGH